MTARNNDDDEMITISVAPWKANHDQMSKVHLFLVAVTIHHRIVELFLAVVMYGMTLVVVVGVDEDSQSPHYSVLVVRYDGQVSMKILATADDHDDDHDDADHVAWFVLFISLAVSFVVVVSEPFECV